MTSGASAAVGIARGPAEVESNIAAFGPAQFLQALPEHENAV
jgi:hypothetical protein